jgi:hypothetical protein
MAEQHPSFEFAKTLPADENLRLVIRAHLHAEQLLFAMLTEGLADPTVLDLDRLTFLTKVRLAIAIGLMSKNVLPALTGLNTLRNNFSHKFGYQFTDKAKADLLSTMPTEIVELMLTDEHDGKTTPIHTRQSVPLDHILRVLVCVMEARRQIVVDSKAAEAAATARLRNVLDRLKGR